MAYHKVLATPGEPAVGVLQGWRALIEAHRLKTQTIVLAIHSTTLVTNLIIERRGAQVGLLTTRGCRKAGALHKEHPASSSDIKVLRTVASER